MTQFKHIVIVFTASMSSFLDATRSLWTKSFARLEYNYLNNSEFVIGSNFKSSSTFRQTSVQGNLFSVGPSCFNFSTFFRICRVFLQFFLKVSFLIFRVSRLFTDFLINIQFCLFITQSSLIIKLLYALSGLSKLSLLGNKTLSRVSLNTSGEKPFQERKIISLCLLRFAFGIFLVQYMKE